jgi:hypothetical protein
VSSSEEEDEGVTKTTWMMRQIFFLKSIGANFPISTMFDNILEVHDDVAGNVDNVLDKVMTSEADCEEESLEEEVETSVCEEPPTHQTAIHCVKELERYAFTYNQAELIETLFGLRRIIKREWVNLR